MLKYVLITSLAILLSATSGLFCLVRANRIVQFFLSSSVMTPFRVWWKSEYAEISIRLCGVFMLLISAFLAFVMIRGLLG
jgi:hypothetical protein